MLRSRRKLLLDVTLSCNEITDFIVGKGFQEFQGDRMLQLAIEREFEIIGEALYRLAMIEEETLNKRIPEFER